MTNTAPQPAVESAGTTPSSGATPSPNDAASERLAHWLTACAHGDQAALRELHRATHRRLLAEALRVLGNAECAEEVLQDAYVNVWRAAATFNPAMARPMTWLLRVVRHRAIDRLRLRRAERASTVPLDADLAGTLACPAPAPEAQAQQNSQQLQLSRGLTGLARDHRQALALALYRGYSHPEIAAACGVCESTAKNWVRHGVTHLRAFAAAERAAA